jgi:hypothetical protein
VLLVALVEAVEAVLLLVALVEEIMALAPLQVYLVVAVELAVRVLPDLNSMVELAIL